MFGWLAVFHLFILLIALSINPTKAYADTYIGGPYENVNDAGLTYLGYDYDELETEGAHTALNELVMFPSKYPDYTFWVGSFYEQFDPLNLNPGYYWSRYDGMQFVDLTDRARADVVKAAKAADNSSQDTPSDFVTFDVVIPRGIYSQYGWYVSIVSDDGKVYTSCLNSDGTPHNADALLPNHILVKVPSTTCDAIMNLSNTDKNNDGLCFRISTTSDNSVGTFQLFYKSAGLRDKFTLVVGNISSLGQSYDYYKRVDTSVWPTGYYSRMQYPKNGVVHPETSSGYTFDGNTLTVSGSFTIIGSSDNSMNTYAAGNMYGTGFVAVYGPNPPDPEPDPEPEIPTAPPETPTAPDLPEPDLPTEPVVPESPDLSDLLAALDEHCQHIQLAIYNGLDDYYTSITKYYEDVVKWLADTYKYYDNELDKRFQVLFNFLRSTNQYLKNIDDNVQEILDKLDGLGEQIGLGDIPDSYDNNNVATDGSSALSNAYNSIRNKFPFSVLDNLLTLVTSLNHDAVAPVVSLPVGNPFGSEPYMVEMDFTDWSDLAAIVRTGELVVAYLGMSKSAIKMWTGGEGEAE